MRKYTTLPFTEYTTVAYDDKRKPITQIIIHSTVGSVSSAIATFSSSNAKTSAHYIIGNDGKLWAGLEEYYVAYHSGNYDVNQISVGIEHEWYQGIVPSSALYTTSAKLVSDICKYYGLGINRGVVKGHKEIVPTGCPNAIDVDRIVREAQALTTPVTDYKKLYEESLRKIADLKQTEIRLQKEKADLQNEMSSKLAEKDVVCLQKIKDIKVKIISYINTL